jgi:hypothetical protein
MFTQPRRRILVLSLPFVVALVSAVSAHAQTVATNFDELRLKVKAGDTIYVIEGNGEERRARVLEVAPSSLAVSIGGKRLDLSENSVGRIRQRLPDPLWNGAAIGAGVYLAVAGGMVATIGEGNCDAGCWAINGLLAGGIGASIGVGIDALIKGRKTIYEAGDRQPSTSVVMRPVLSAGAKGLSVSVGW